MVGAKNTKLKTMAPTTRSMTRKVRTRSATASAVAKKGSATEGAAVAGMPPKREGDVLAKMAKMRKKAKAEKVASMKKGPKNRREGLCTECGEPGYFGTVCDCDGEALCEVSIVESIPSECFSSD
jgi:hypothetical protein